MFQEIILSKIAHMNCEMSFLEISEKPAVESTPSTSLEEVPILVKLENTYTGNAMDSTVSHENGSGDENCDKSCNRLRRSLRFKKEVLYSEDRKDVPKPDDILKKAPMKLETIFEEPKLQKEQLHYMGGRKLKRVMTFSNLKPTNTKLKTKKRLMKAKKVLVSEKVKTRKKISMNILMKKLADVENETS